MSASVDCEATPVEFVRSRAGFGAVAVWFSKAPPSKVAPFDVTTPQRRKIVLEQDVFGPRVLVAKSLKVQEVKVTDALFSTDNTGFGVTGANWDEILVFRGAKPKIQALKFATVLAFAILN